jgi:Homeobox KN domain
MQYNSSDMITMLPQSTTEQKEDLQEVEDGFAKNKHNPTSLNPQLLDASTKGNSRDFTNSSQEENNDNRGLEKKANGIQLSFSNSGHSDDKHGESIQPERDMNSPNNTGKLLMVDEIGGARESKACIDGVFESSICDLKPEYLDLKIRFFTKSIFRIERIIEEAVLQEFSGMQANFVGTKQKQVLPVIELLKIAYTERLKIIINDLRAKTKSIEYITMKEIQTYFSNLEESLRQKVKLFVAKQTELLRFTNINSDESDSSQDQQNPAEHRQMTDAGKPLMKFKQEMDSNFGSIHSSERRTARSKNNKSSDVVRVLCNKLPRSASKILNQWLSDHLDDPYPTQEEKVLLASKTKLSLRQITNWFVNHRGRKLKNLKNKGSFSQQIKSKLLASTIQH